MTTSSQNKSCGGYCTVPFEAGAKMGNDERVVPARNVEVKDAGAVEKDAAPEIPADRIRVEDPARRGSAYGVSSAQKIKGAAQMAGGAALVAAGVPLCVLPGPGVACIAGGAALASKGQRNFTGREATPLEARLDEAAERLGAVAKEQAASAAHAAAEKAPEVADRVARTVVAKAPEVADRAARAVAAKAPEVAGKAVRATAKTAPKVAHAAAKAAPKVVGAAAKAAKVGVGFVVRRRNGSGK